MKDMPFFLELPTIMICRKGIEKELRTEILLGAKERKQRMFSSALQDRDLEQPKALFSS